MCQPCGPEESIEKLNDLYITHEFGKDFIKTRQLHRYYFKDLYDALLQQWNVI